MLGPGHMGATLTTMDVDDVSDDELIYVTVEEDASSNFRKRGLTLTPLNTPSSVLRSRSVETPTADEGFQGLSIQTRRMRSISLETINGFRSPRVLSAPSPSFSSRAASPATPSYIKYFPVDFEPPTAGQGMVDLSPIVVVRKTTSYSPFYSPSPRTTNKGNSISLQLLLKRAEEAITPDFIDHLLTLQTVESAASRSTHSLGILRQVAQQLSLSPSEEGIGIFSESPKLRIFSRLISEVLVDVCNSERILEAHSRAAPFVETYISLATFANLPMDFLLVLPQNLLTPQIHLEDQH